MFQHELGWTVQKVKVAAVPKEYGLEKAKYAYLAISPLTATVDVTKYVKSSVIQAGINLKDYATSVDLIKQQLATQIEEVRATIQSAGISLVSLNGNEFKEIRYQSVTIEYKNALDKSKKLVSSPAGSRFLEKAVSIGLAVGGLLELAMSLSSPPPRPEDVASLAFTAGLQCFTALTMFTGDPLGGVALLGCAEGLVATVISFARLLADNSQFIAISPAAAKSYYSEAVRMLQGAYGLADKYGYYMLSGSVSPAEAQILSLLTKYGLAGVKERLKGGQSPAEILAEAPSYAVQLPPSAASWISEHSGVYSSVKILGGEQTAKETLKLLQKYYADPGSTSVENQLLGRIKFVQVQSLPSLAIGQILGFSQPFKQIADPLSFYHQKQIPSVPVQGAPPIPMNAQPEARGLLAPPAAVKMQLEAKGANIPPSPVGELRQAQPFSIPNINSEVQLLNPYIVDGGIIGLGLVKKIADVVSANKADIARLKNEVKTMQVLKANLASKSEMSELADEMPDCCGKDINTGMRKIRVPSGIKLPWWAVPKMGVAVPSLPFLGLLTAAGAGIALIMKLLEKIENY